MVRAMCMCVHCVLLFVLQIICTLCVHTIYDFVCSVSFISFFFYWNSINFVCFGTLFYARQQNRIGLCSGRYFPTFIFGFCFLSNVISLINQNDSQSALWAAVDTSQLMRSTRNYYCWRLKTHRSMQIACRSRR